MFKLTAFFVLSALSLCASAAPVLQKRINQTTIDSVTPWETACTNAGGGAQCNPIAVSAAATLLAAAGPCDQQNSGDQMIDLAKQLKSDPEMIRLAQIFVQQPRNAPDSLQVPYCQQAPKNAELNGLFHCQFSGSKFPQFSGDGSGNVPLGLTAVNPPGSCPANPSGPVPDGVQLNTLVQNPGVGGATSSGSAGSGAGSASSTGAGSASPSTGVGANNGGSGAAAGDGAPASVPAAATSAAAQAPASTAALAAGATKSFTHQNGLDAQALNQKFASLTASSSCTSGENACVNNAFAQCVNGKFVSTSCAGGTVCAALPLVNSAGTSITCTTAADRDARIA
ncbi:hypothetical protein P691DRAFT_627410, partial [Macrolepiota fuliginosa MF-IS2]